MLILIKQFRHRHNLIAYQGSILCIFITNYLKDQAHFVKYQFDVKKMIDYYIGRFLWDLTIIKLRIIPKISTPRNSSR